MSLVKLFADDASCVVASTWGRSYEWLQRLCAPDVTPERVVAFFVAIEARFLAQKYLAPQCTSRARACVCECLRGRRCCDSDCVAVDLLSGHAVHQAERHVGSRVVAFLEQAHDAAHAGRREFALKIEHPQAKQQLLVRLHVTSEYPAVAPVFARLELSERERTSFNVAEWAWALRWRGSGSGADDKPLDAHLTRTLFAASVPSDCVLTHLEASLNALKVGQCVRVALCRYSVPHAAITRHQL